MFESLAAIVISFKEVVTSLTNKRLLFWFLFIGFITFLSFYIYEIYSSSFYFDRINKKIDTIIKIDNQVKADTTLKQNIHKEYDKIVKELSEYNVDRKVYISETIKFSKKIKEGLLKFLSAIIVPIIILIFGRSGESKEELNEMILGAILIGLIGGIIAIFIPIIYNPWINYLCFPLLELIILLIIGLYSD